MILLNGMIQTGRLSEFVDEFIMLYNEEQQEKTAYEVWLHKVYDKSFSDFMQEINGTHKAAPTQEDIADTIQGSRELLNSFRPLSGGAQNRDISTAGNHSG